MEKKELMYEGKAKRVYSTENPEYCIVSYKDDATAFNGEKKGTIVGKGVVNNRMSNFMFEKLEALGVKTHLVEELNDRDTVVKKVTIVPLEVIVRNTAAGSLATRLGLPEGTKMRCPVLEFCYKDDALGDPMVNDYHILAAGFATREEIDQIADMALKVNAMMVEYFLTVDVDLIDFKIEFGKTSDGEIILADEISPDTCRFWDVHTGEKLDKDRFRRDMGGVEEAYAEMMKRLGLSK
ncbi:MAG: phosphoribosylaminoimidazolesuccinocarboxamide synthase [Clostridia bacterium]